MRKAKIVTRACHGTWCHPSSQRGLRDLNPKQRSSHISVQSSPVFNHVSIISSPPQNPDCVLVIPLLHKEPLSPEYKVSHLFPIASLSLRGFFCERHKPTSCPDSSWVSWYPTHTVYKILHGPLWCHWLFWFFSLPLLPPILAWSIGHCPVKILGAKLIEEQFTVSLNNSQWRFNAIADLVIRQPI